MDEQLAPQTYVAVIEDEASLRAATGRLLRVAGFQPIGYSSAEAFLADDKHPRFDCLLVDIRLGGMSGLDLLRQLRVDAHPPVVFITAFDDPTIQAQAEALGCARYFRKSTPGIEVIAAIQHLTTRPSEGS